jgi:hypothetical protein
VTGGRNCLYFYPKDYIEKAAELGITDKDETAKKGKWFMIPFSWTLKKRSIYTVMYLLLSLIPAGIIL